MMVVKWQEAIANEQTKMTILGHVGIVYIAGE